MDPTHCNLNWKTCGHCSLGIDSHGKPYGCCDQVGFWGSLFGGNVCFNAPPYSDYEELAGVQTENETKNRNSFCAECEVRLLRKTIEELEEELNKDESKPLDKIRSLISQAKSVIDNLLGDN